MLQKEQVMASLAEMPSEFSLDELVERMIFILDIEKGLKELREGKGIPHEEVKKMIQSWGK